MANSVATKKALARTSRTTTHLHELVMRTAHSAVRINLTTLHLTAPPRPPRSKPALAAVTPTYLDQPMTNRSVTHATFVIERTCPVSPQRVFAGWADPA